MDPAIPFSMAHFYRETTFGQVDDMGFVLFPPISITLPQAPTGTVWDNDTRRAMWVSAVFNELHRVANPDWDSFDRCVIFFASAGTELTGGGLSYTPGQTFVPIVVFSSDSRFDMTAQEFGHSFGLNHEWDSTGMIEYGCPFSVMSARTQVRSFERPFDSRLPGTMAPGDPSRICGPLIPMAHLYINEGRAVNPNAAINHVDTVTYVPVDYAQSPQRVRLVARDVALAAWPARRSVLAVIPPVVSGGDTHFLELRRADTAYEQGIGNASVVILAGNFFNGSTAVSDTSKIRLKYMGSLDVTGAGGDLDFRSLGGGFVAQINSVDLDFGAVDLTVRSGGGPGSYGVRLGEPVETRTARSTTAWTTVEVAPCRSYPKKRYAYRTTEFGTLQVFTARSLGYEQPRFAWYINDVQLTAASAIVPVSTMCKRFDRGEISQSERRDVLCDYAIIDNTLQLTVSEALYDIDLTVRVVVSEGSPPAVGDPAPERGAMVTAWCSTIDVEWDQAFQTDRENCLRETVEQELGGTIHVGGSPGGITSGGIREGILRMLGIGIPGHDVVGTFSEVGFDVPDKLF